MLFRTPAMLGGGIGIAAVAAGVQYSDAADVTITGRGFNAQTVVRVDGVAMTTAFVSATELTATIPTARTVGSPFRTAGAKALTTSHGGSVTWTVNAWSEIDEAACTGLWIASPDDCNGATGDLQVFTPWTDRNGTEDLVQSGADASKVQYVPVGSRAEAWTVPSVYAGNTGRHATRTAQTINGTSYMVIVAVNAYLANGLQQTFLQFDAGNRRLYVPASSTVVRWTDQPNGGGGGADISTASLGAAASMANWAVYSIWRDTSTNVHMARNADAEYTSASCNDSSGSGGVMQIGPNAGNQGYATMPYLSTWSADPGATVRARARNKAMILAGLA